MSYRILLFAFILFISSCRNQSTVLIDSKVLPYPSGSGMEFHNDKLYIMGDDATHLLILDSSFKIIDSIQLDSSIQRRLPKDSKPDLESISVIKDRNRDSIKLLLLGSGSSPNRNLAWILNPRSLQKESWDLDTFYSRIKSKIPELNIEGACFFANSILLSCRGHKGYPKNYLVTTLPEFWTKQLRSSLTFIKIGSNGDTAQFQGVSGLTYSEKSDKLILSVSTEDTRSVYEDGAIGKSYIWIVDNFTSKRRWDGINPNRVIDLEKIDSRFRGQKIESVCILKETRHFFHLALVADNDDGSSSLFKLIVNKD
jgi:hypothetical protein